MMTEAGGAGRKNSRATRAYKEGWRAFDEGKRLDENPFTYMGTAMLGMAAWWEAGWNAAKNHMAGQA